MAVVTEAGVVAVVVMPIVSAAAEDVRQVSTELSVAEVVDPASQGLKV
jgi:hypothetical protein